jgi:HSP20 family protein
MRRHIETPKGGKKEKALHVDQNKLPDNNERAVTATPRALWTRIEEMERWMEDTMHRPFLFDFGLRPITRLIHDLRGADEITPTVDMFMDCNNVVVKAELPGIGKDDLNVKIVDNHLVICGEKKGEDTIERDNYLRVERTWGTFNRTIHLPEGMRTDNVTATFKDGVLEIRLPMEVAAEAKTIAIE